MAVSMPWAVGFMQTGPADPFKPASWMTAKQYSTRDAAKVAAAELAKLYPGTKVLIFQALDVIEYTDVEVTKIVIEKQVVSTPYDVVELMMGGLDLDFAPNPRPGKPL